MRIRIGASMWTGAGVEDDMTMKINDTPLPGGNSSPKFASPQVWGHIKNVCVTHIWPTLVAVSRGPLIVRRLQ